MSEPMKPPVQLPLLGEAAEVCEGDVCVIPPR